MLKILPIFLLPVLFFSITGCEKPSPESSKRSTVVPAAPIDPLEGLPSAEAIIADIESQVPHVVPPRPPAPVTNTVDHGNESETQIAFPGHLAPPEGITPIEEIAPDEPASPNVGDLLNRVQHSIRSGNLAAARREAEEAVAAIDPAAPERDKARFYLRAANLMLLIGGNERARAWTRTGADAAAKIADPGEAVETLIAFAELFARLGDSASALDIVERMDFFLYENGSEAERMAKRNELLKGRNRTMRRIAKIQASIGSAEDAWETIERIDDSQIRDLAILDMIGLFLRLGRTDDARAWLQEIGDAELREKVETMIDDENATNGKAP